MNGGGQEEYRGHRLRWFSETLYRVVEDQLDGTARDFGGYASPELAREMGRRFVDQLEAAKEKEKLRDRHKEELMRVFKAGMGMGAYQYSDSQAEIAFEKWYCKNL